MSLNPSEAADNCDWEVRRAKLAFLVVQNWLVGGRDGFTRSLRYKSEQHSLVTDVCELMCDEDSS